MNVTQTYILTDSIFYDKAGATWRTSNTTTSFNDNTRSITFNSNGSNVYIEENNTSLFIPCIDDFIVEFDFTSDGAPSIYFNIPGQNYNMGVGANRYNWGDKRVKLLVKPSENRVEIYLDGEFYQNIINSRDFGSATTCGLVIRNNTQYEINFTLGNLKIYKG